MKKRTISEQLVFELYDEYLEILIEAEDDEEVIVQTEYSEEELETIRRLFGSLFGESDIFWLRGIENKPYICSLGSAEVQPRTHTK